MGSRDGNHESVGRWFRESGATTLDLHTLGDGAPDWLVGYEGTERLVETKEPAAPRDVRRLSTRCARCNKTWPMHTKRPSKTCGSFERQFVTSRTAGVLSHRQAKWHREWAGHPPVVVRTEEDVARVLREMADDGHCCLVDAGTEKER